MPEEIKQSDNAKDWQKYLSQTIGDRSEPIDELAIDLLAVELAEYYRYLAKAQGEVMPKARREYERRKDAAFDKALKLMRELQLTPAARKRVIEIAAVQAVDLEAGLRY